MEITCAHCPNTYTSVHKAWRKVLVEARLFGWQGAFESAARDVTCPTCAAASKNRKAPAMIGDRAKLKAAAKACKPYGIDLWIETSHVRPFRRATGELVRDARVSLGQRYNRPQHEVVNATAVATEALIAVGLKLKHKATAWPGSLVITPS